ncbi:MAG: 2-oxoglutarate dehydrogenase E1 [Betaproteobacteria bacterium]|nr:2-oxoglutarate dehydrogenase E1 [Betaproteobacteria bacterium]
MKAISLWQPHATLCAISAKMIETRGRDCQYRGELAIHAAKRWEYDQWTLCTEEPFRSVLEAAGYITWRGQSPIVDLPLGKILAVSDLFDSKRMGDDEAPATWVEQLSDQELAFGHYAPNRFGLFLRDTVRLKTPIACKGSQVIPFAVPPDVEAAVRRMLS